jgi:hypothetical protein
MPQPLRIQWSRLLDSIYVLPVALAAVAIVAVVSCNFAPWS